MSKKTILAVDDEEHILELVEYNLQTNGFNAIKADTGEKALELINDNNIDLVLLDLMLPGIDGLEVLKSIRSNEKTRKLPVILLTAKSDEINKVIGLELGADDYISKPFGVHELIARIKAVLRRIDDAPIIEHNEDHSDDIIVIDDIIINNTTRIVKINGKEIDLSLKEFELLYLLSKNRGRVFSREMLLENIWGYDFYGETRTVDVHISNLRKKIEKDDSNPAYIKTVRGIGYKFN